MAQTLHQNVTNVTKQNIASKEIPMIEFHKKYMKLFVNMLSIICVLLNTEIFYIEIILVQDSVSCEVKNVIDPYINFSLDLDKEFHFKDLYVLTPTGSTIISQKFVDIMFASGAISYHSKMKISTFFLVTKVTLEWA